MRAQACIIIDGKPSNLPYSNDNYSDIQLYSIFHIEYKDIAVITNKKTPANYLPNPPFAGVLVIVSIWRIREYTFVGEWPMALRKVICLLR